MPKTDASCQLAVEKDWLCGNTPGSFLARRTNLPPRWRDIAQRVGDVLSHPELRKVLGVVATHNQNRSTPFLLGPCLFNIIHSLEARGDTLRLMPALGRRSAELRAHYREASTKAKELARLVRQAPQPHIALAGRDDNRAASLFLPHPIIQGRSQSETIMPLDCLLNEAAASIDSVARKIPRAHHHRKAGKTPTVADKRRLKRLAAGRLVIEFRKNLGYPYNARVAEIVEVLTRISTDADYVKKIDKRNRRSNARSSGGQNP
jgi:hypothetical protein